MNKYTTHKHEWQIEYNGGGIVLIKCEKCELCIELFDRHLIIADYTVEDKDGLTLREVLYYDKLIK